MEHDLSEIGAMAISAVPSPAPIAPPSETSPGVDRLIMVSSGLRSLVQLANANPQLKADLMTTFSQQINLVVSQAHTPVGSAIGSLIGWSCVHYGLTAPPPEVTLAACGIAAIVAGYAQQWVLNRLDAKRAVSPPR